MRDPEPLAFDQREGVVAVASDGTDWLIGWRWNARRVFADGTFTAATSVMQIDALEWDGVGYLFAWRPPSSSSSSVRLERISRSGPIVRTVVANMPTPFDYAMKPTSVARIAFADVRIAPEETYGSTSRAFVRFLDLVPRRRAAR